MATKIGGISEPQKARWHAAKERTRRRMGLKELRSDRFLEILLDIYELHDDVGELQNLEAEIQREVTA